jgi:ubiquinone/menaquinone biosynthesis C-methylase UbiE
MRAWRETTTYEAFPEIPARDSLQIAIEVPLLINLLGVPNGKRTVEVGCGSGAALAELHARLQPSSLVGIDIDEALLRDAASRMASRAIPVELLHADVHTLPLPTSSVDLVIDFGTCFHTPDAVGAMREIARVLRPGGWFVHETPVSQMLAHPIRSFARTMPWRDVPSLAFVRTAVLWSARQKVTR